MQVRLPILLALALALASPALAGSYIGGGTFVAKTQLGTLVDNGGVVCQGTQGDGIGGGCLPFPEHQAFDFSFVRVRDAEFGREVAFQVCIDNDGNGVCGGPQLDPRCRDQIFFSHSDDGTFHNPLGPLPVQRLEGCRDHGGFNGYVVLLCQGAHETDGSAHTHQLTHGVIEPAYFGTGYGTFCGGGGSEGQPGGLGFQEAVAKAYTIR